VGTLMTQFRSEKSVRGAIEAEWQRRAIAACLEQARSIVRESINAKTPVGSLSDVEWGWISTAIVFAWISTKAQEAVQEGLPSEDVIRTMEAYHREPNPWEAGAVETTLPALGGVEGLDWSSPLANLSKAQMIKLCWHAFRLVNGALAARDEGARDEITKHFDADVREMSGANGGMLVTPGEIPDDGIPF
jgi:hypothetical protein